MTGHFKVRAKLNDFTSAIADHVKSNGHNIKWDQSGDFSVGQNWLCKWMVHMKQIICELRIWNQMKNDPRSYDRNFYNCVKKPEKKNSGLQRGLNPWPRDTGATLYQLSYLKPLTLGAGQFWVHMNIWTKKFFFFHMHHSLTYLSREHMNPKLTCSQRQWQQPLLNEIFKEPSIISYRKGRSLKDILVRAKLW